MAMRRRFAGYSRINPTVNHRAKTAAGKFIARRKDHTMFCNNNNGNNVLWLILILILFCGCGNNNGNGCGCGCNDGCGCG